MNKVLGIVLTGVICGTVSSTAVAAADYILDRPVTVQVGGKSVDLAAGQTLTVVGNAGANAIVRVPLANGTAGMTSIPLASMHVKAVAPAPALPAAATTPTAPVAAATPAPTAVVKAAPAMATGWTTKKLAALPAPAKKPKGFDYNFDPAAETFQIYVPSGYDPAKPCGVVGWTSPNDPLAIPRQFAPLFDEFQLIAVSAERCGNNQESSRRVGLLVSAILELSKTMNIDKRRLVLSGFSGGGRVSALGAFVHPEIFCGAVSWCGGTFYKDYPNSAKANSVFYGFTHDDKHGYSAAQASEAKKNVKFVLLTGSKDSNLGSSRDIQSAMKKEHFQVELIEQPELAHAVGSVENMRKGLEFVLGSPRK